MALTPSDHRSVQQHQVFLGGEVIEGARLPAEGFAQALRGLVTGEAQAAAFDVDAHQQIAEVSDRRRNLWLFGSVLVVLRCPLLSLVGGKASLECCI